MGLLQKVVKNEAMKSDPPEIYGWKVFFLSASACFGGMLFGWDIGSIGGILVMGSFKEAYGLNKLSDGDRANLQSNIVSTLQGGCFFGSLIAYWVADRFGRKPALLVSSVITILGIIIQCASDGHVEALYVGRLVAGFGVGAASMLTPLYVSENAPRAIRGGLTGIYQLFIATGVMLSFWINYGTLQNLTGNAQWQVPLALQALPAVCLFIGIVFCNESPRWLARQDNWEKATEVLGRLRHLPVDHAYVQMELEEMRDQLENERLLIGGAGFWDLQKEMWTIKGNRNRALVSIGLMICQQMTGTNAINYYAPLIFENLGIPKAQNGLFATGIYGIVKMVTCAVFLLIAADSLGRRRSLLWTSIAQGCAMFVIGFYTRFKPPIKGEPIPPVGYFALTCIFLFAGFFQFGWGPCCWIIVSEIPTARLRAMNVAIAAATQWLFNFVVAQAVPHMLVNVGKGGYGTYFIFGSFCFAMFFFVWFLIPETKGLSLERMDDIFGITELVKEKVHGDEEAHHKQSELHETTTAASNATRNEKSGTAHIENDEVRAAA
ncbi:MFS general substrate transporter [Venustampulla echinocandica]|uniref:MFS general substrate transporter n=1 Tax=Venustampulla echinocandica TaxID=2656787 RepID=A0A370TIW9_9HELO|nr:MFS general substrate transporter [Venustampulla echinocandica]RDL35290.1 MFS general substrate transporter [Venustampulla echinocandica]